MEDPRAFRYPRERKPFRTTRRLRAFFRAKVDRHRRDQIALKVREIVASRLRRGVAA